MYNFTNNRIPFLSLITTFLLLVSVVQAGDEPDLIFKNGLEVLHTLSYSADANGSVMGQSNQMVEQGSDGIAVSALANAGYSFVNWSDNSTDNPRTDLNVQADITVVANFAQDALPQYTLTYASGGNGILSGTLVQTVEQGSDGSAIEAFSDFGYHFDNWSDASTGNPRTDTNVQANITVTANFAINTYTVTYTAGDHGSINGTSVQTVDFNTTTNPVTAVADASYHFVDWSDASTDNPRSDSNVEADISVTANFEVDVVFGQAGLHAVALPYLEPNNEATIYYPTDASAANKVPVVFLSPGWGSTDPDRYKTMMSFIASHGYAVIYAQDKNHWHPSDQVTDYMAMINDAAINPLIDTTRMGVIGHSLGGGHTFGILDILSEAPYNYGVNGRFVFAIEPWFAFDMMQADMLALPDNTNVVIQQYGIDGYNDVNDTDPRIPLTEFYLMESIADNQKDYQVYCDASLDHYYPYDDPVGGAVDYSTKQVILAPLDALMKYTFVDSNDMVAHDASLEQGNDDPYADGNGIQIVYPRGEAHVGFPCNGVNFTVYDIDFCDIKGYPYTSQFDYLATNDNTVQPILGGAPSTDAEFGTTITRFTERLLQNDTPTQNGNGDRYPRGNAHPYSKTQAWNADMTMIRMNYRIYDAQTLQEIPLTTPSGNYPLTTATWSLSDLYNINGSLNERKWSSQDPNVFFGVYLTWDKKGEIWKGTIDRNTSTISYSQPHPRSFGAANTYEKFSLGKFEGNIDFNDQFVALVGRKIGGSFITVIVYDMINDTFVEKDFDGNNGNALVNWTENPVPQEFDWVSVSPLGNYIIMSTSGNLELYDMDLNYIGQLSDEATHGDMGIAQNGEEVFVNFQFTAPQGIYAERLQKFVDEVNDPAPNVVANYHHRLLPEKYNGGHVSCRNYKRPGWCYLSTVAEGHREVSALRINFADMSLNVVNRFAQTHTFTEGDGSSMGSLGGVSPDGKRVLFFTDWEESPLNYYDRDTYQAQRVD
jgi:hypothetical protein